eukprot:comp15168_c0_seq1/m.11877 comp15168_c0_seq1/g.11877  ORF comp15168_c0_seq1/g.11877 comp15168_c0_seq1/m.11877 type:complete len:200 (-) comp15168_c0_seq1:506-1105(-)
MGVRETLYLHFDMAPSSPVPHPGRMSLQPGMHTVLLTWLAFEPLSMRIRGAVAVSGLPSSTDVFVRYSLDNWVSCRDEHAVHVQSECTEGPPVDNEDTSCTNHFFFSIQLPRHTLPGQHVSFALCSVDAFGAKHWNNNNGRNFDAEIVTRQRRLGQASSGSSLSLGSLPSSASDLTSERRFSAPHHARTPVGAHSAGAV